MWNYETYYFIQILSWKKRYKETLRILKRASIEWISKVFGKIKKLKFMLSAFLGQYTMSSTITTQLDMLSFPTVVERGNLVM